MPPIQSLEDFRPDVISPVYSDDGRIIGDFALQRRTVVSYEDIPPYLKLAIIAVEDAQFFNHNGINYFSIVRAVTKDLLRWSFPLGKGASTITQQLSRMLLDRYEKTWDRKIKEFLTARKIEQRYSKQQILTLYANLHHMGPGIYGVASAADYYFGKELKDLTLEESAMIAGLQANATRYSPRRNPSTALARRNLAIDRMAAENMISRKLAEETKLKPIVLAPARRSDSAIAPYFVEWVRQSLATRYSTDEIFRAGMQINTTLNIEMQQAANRALQENLRNYDKQRGWRGAIGAVPEEYADDLGAYQHPGWRSAPNPGEIVVGLVEKVGAAEASIRIGNYRGTIGSKEIAWTNATSPARLFKAGDLAYFRVVSLDHDLQTCGLLLEQIPEVDGAIIILDNSTGAIKAMVGGYDFRTSEFNRATQAMRQIGSTIKPILYTAALEHGLNADSTLLDEPFEHLDALGRKWEPQNYDRTFKGKISLRQALAESRNIPAVRTADLIGIDNLVIMARRFGLSGRLDPFLPLALGTNDATPIEVASAFSAFPNLGIRAEPYFIRSVTNHDNVTLEKHEPRTHQVLSPEIAAQMLDLLQNTIQGEGGTGRSARSLNRPIGGKTGTTNDFTDAWFAGFTPSLTAVVWVGFNEKKTMGPRQSGGVVALPIWIDCMREILNDQPVEQFASQRFFHIQQGD
ncbi:MAG TPA: PBP1A family penicillin-binding protein, partial [Acidobacteriota bacterium]|nr:PBP1A family penicillin-binding protein [Acidobacteriota bacterium]